MTSKAGSAFCVYCGEVIAGDTDAWLCPQCGLKACATCMSGGSDTCPDCKVPLSQGGGSTKPPDENAAASSQPSANGAADRSEANSTGQPPPSPAGPTAGGEQTAPAPPRVSIPVYTVDQNAWRATGRGHGRSFGPTTIFVVTVISFVLAIGALVLMMYLSSTYYNSRHVSSIPATLSALLVPNSLPDQGAQAIADLPTQFPSEPPASFKKWIKDAAYTMKISTWHGTEPQQFATTKDQLIWAATNADMNEMIARRDVSLDESGRKEATERIQSFYRELFTYINDHDVSLSASDNSPAVATTWRMVRNSEIYRYEYGIYHHLTGKNPDYQPWENRDWWDEYQILKHPS